MDPGAESLPFLLLAGSVKVKKKKEFLTSLCNRQMYFYVIFSMLYMSCREQTSWWFWLAPCWLGESASVNEHWTFLALIFYTQKKKQLSPCVRVLNTMVFILSCAFALTRSSILLGIDVRVLTHRQTCTHIHTQIYTHMHAHTNTRLYIAQCSYIFGKC